MPSIEPLEASGTPGFALLGRWATEHLEDVRAGLSELADWRAERLVLDGARLEYIDPIPAWLLWRTIASLEDRGVSVETRNLRIDHFDIFRNTPPPPPASGHRTHRRATRRLAAIGAQAWQAATGLSGFLAFLGHAALALGRGLIHPGRLRLRAISFHVRATGLQAIPIVALIAFLISVVLAYQGADQLARFGASVYTIDLVAISVLREMGVLLTAIMVAGRSGSAFAAEIGVMKSNEEIDALRTMGLDPFEVLIVPRLLALVIALPLLTLLADLVGLAGAGVLSLAMLDLSLPTFLARVADTVSFNTFWAGIIKAPFFALIIGLVGTWRGMQVAGSAESVGRLTTRAVVESIFLVIAADAVFSILFSKLGI